MYHLKNLSRTAIPVLLFLAIASLFTTNALAQSNLTVSPAVVVFPDTAVGTISYFMVTITNNGSDAELITGAEPANAPLWATWGGTCNDLAHNKSIPAGESCTFQWGFNPDRPGRVTTIGTISFQSGASLGVVLTGKGTPK